MHFHAYTSRVPGHLANGSPESEPGTAKTSLGDKAEYIPTAGLGDFYRSTHPPRVIRRWLLRDPKLIRKTCETVDEAAAWYAEWLAENRRPAYRPTEENVLPEPEIKIDPKTGPTEEQQRLLDARARRERVAARLAPIFAQREAETPEEVAARSVEFARGTLRNGNDVVSGHYTGGGEYVSAYLIPCPAREISGFPTPPPCPVGRH